jgi:hypothetical protein
MSGTTSHHLAQFNVATLSAPLESAQLADFVANLEPINTLGDRSPGFVWRLQTDEGDATSIRMYDDERIIVNLSVWETPEDLWNYAYATQHLDFLRRRREWFLHTPDHTLVLWWVEAGHIPSLQEAKERLEHLRQHGPGPRAFTFRNPQPPPGAADHATAVAP